MTADQSPAVHLDSFEVLVHSTGVRLLRAATLLCGDSVRAEDLVQSAYAAAWARWRLVSRADHPYAYVRKMLTHIYLREERRSRVRVVDADVDVAGRSDNLEVRISLMEALRTLPPLDRAAIVLRYWDDLPVSEVAALLNVSEAACRTRTSRALTRLRKDFPSLEDSLMEVDT